MWKPKQNELITRPSCRLPTRAKAITIALTYAGLSALWIFGSEGQAQHFVQQVFWGTLVEVARRFIFILVTAFLLGLMLDRYFRAIRRAAQELHDNERRLGLVDDNLPKSYVYEYMRDPEGKPRFTHISAGVERVHGLKVAEVLRDAGCLLGQIDPAQWPAYLAAEAESARNLKDFEMELLFRLPSGDARVVHAHSRPRRNEEGHIVWDGFVSDITERKHIEADQAAITARYRSLFGNMLNGFAHCRMIFEDGKPADFLYLDVNPAFKKLTDLNNVIGKRASEATPGIHITDPGLLAAFGRVAFTGVPEQFEVYVEALKNWFEISVYCPAKEHFVAIFNVVTERKKAEAALHEREDQLRLFVDHCPAGIAMLDREMRYLAVSRRFVSDYKLGEQNIIGRSHYEAFPEIPERWKAVHQRCLAGAIEKNEADAFPRADGRTDWVRWEIRPWHTAAGRIGGIIIFSEDITERIRAEEALRLSEMKFARAFANTPVAIALTRLDDGQFLEVNDTWVDLCGFSREELIGRRVLTMGIWPAAQDRAQFVRELRQKGVVRGWEQQFRKKSGQAFVAELSAQILTFDREELTISILVDVTARRKAEAERMRLITALEQTAESIVITDLAGMILYVNPAFERLSGYSRREAIGQNPRLLQSGKHDAAFYNQMWNTLTRGEVWRGHFVNKRKNGSLFEENATISPVRDASGKIVNYMAIKLDVTREVELEGQFRQAQKLEAIGQLAGGVAHDFNNILTSILIQAELGSMETGLSNNIHETFQQIRCDAERAAALTRQLLLFSRRQVMQSRDVNLNEVVSHLARMLQRIIGEDVHLELKLHAGPLMTHADAGMLDQVVMNLAVNARDAMPDGGRLIIRTSEEFIDEKSAQCQPDAVPGRYVCLTVTDTGCGIPADVLPRIFEPFFTTKEAGKGTGLGLATVFGIVKQHRGWIAVDSKSGQGATFKVFLPAVVTTMAGAIEKPVTKPRGGNETLLLAEDDSSVRFSLRTVLARNGYKILEVSNGQEALEIWAEHRAAVSLLLTDLVMPGGISGKRLARQLKAEKPGLKVIYTSGHSAEIAGREIQLQNGETFVQKPFNPETLLKTIRGCLDDLKLDRSQSQSNMAPARIADLQT